MNTYDTSDNVTDTDWEIFSKWIKGVLITMSETIVTFTKKDGSERIMKCTLHPDILPTKEVSESKESRKQSDSTIAVYDLDAQGWRSFTIRSVKRVEFTMSDD